MKDGELCEWNISKDESDHETPMPSSTQEIQKKQEPIIKAKKTSVPIVIPIATPILQKVPSRNTKIYNGISYHRRRISSLGKRILIHMRSHNGEIVSKYLGMISSDKKLLKFFFNEFEHVDCTFQEFQSLLARLPQWKYCKWAMITSKGDSISNWDQVNTNDIIVKGITIKDNHSFPSSPRILKSSNVKLKSIGFDARNMLYKESVISTPLTSREILLKSRGSIIKCQSVYPHKRSLYNVQSMISNKIMSWKKLYDNPHKAISMLCTQFIVSYDKICEYLCDYASLSNNVHDLVTNYSEIQKDLFKLSKCLKIASECSILLTRN